jgi:hypothetical protein
MSTYADIYQGHVFDYDEDEDVLRCTRSGCGELLEPDSGFDPILGRSPEGMRPCAGGDAEAAPVDTQPASRVPDDARFWVAREWSDNRIRTTPCGTRGEVQEWLDGQFDDVDARPVVVTAGEYRAQSIRFQRGADIEATEAELTRAVAEFVDDTPVDEPMGHDEREAAHDLLHTFLSHGISNEPLRGEVRAALYSLLAVLALSEHPEYESEPASQAAGWRVAVKKYRELLAEVRANGVSGTREGVSTP